MSDGNIVIEAENCQFRVHKSILARNSAVFADVFALPEASEAAVRVVEGCQVVEMSDKAEEWTHVLKALYERGYVPVISPSRDDLDAIAVAFLDHQPNIPFQSFPPS